MTCRAYDFVYRYRSGYRGVLKCRARRGPLTRRRLEGVIATQSGGTEARGLSEESWFITLRLLANTWSRNGVCRWTLISSKIFSESLNCWLMGPRVAVLSHRRGQISWGYVELGAIGGYIYVSVMMFDGAELGRAACFSSGSGFPVDEPLVGGFRLQRALPLDGATAHANRSIPVVAPPVNVVENHCSSCLEDIEGLEELLVQSGATDVARWSRAPLTSKEERAWLLQRQTG